MKLVQCITVSLILAVSMLLSAPVSAQEMQVYTWVGAQSRDWANPMNWNSGSVPDGFYGALIEPSPPGFAGPIVGDSRVVASVGVHGNSLSILSSGSLLSGAVYGRDGSQISVSGSFSTKSIDNSGSFDLSYTGALTLLQGSVTPTYIRNSGTLSLSGAVSLVDGMEFSNTGRLILASRVNIPASVLFSNTGNLDLAGTLNLRNDASLSNTTGTLNLTGGTINGGIVSIDSGPRGGTEWNGYGTLNARVLTLQGSILVDGGRTLSIVANDAASNSFVLGALAGYYGGNTLSIGASGGNALVNNGEIYAARLPGGPAGSEGVLELVGNAAGTAVLENRARIFPGGGVQIAGVLAVRNPSGGNVLVQNDGDVLFEHGSHMTIDPGSNFALQGNGQLMLDDVDLAAPSGAGIMIGGQSIVGSGSIAFTPTGTLGTITPAGNPRNSPPSGVGQLSLIPDGALTATRIAVNSGSTLLLDMRNAGEFGVGGDSYISGQLIVHGPDDITGVRFSSNSNLFVGSGGEMQLRGGRHMIDGAGNIQLQGTILGERGSESLVLAINTWSSGSPGAITQFASFENRALLGASGVLRVDAGTISNTGSVVASNGGTVTLNSLVVTNAGTVSVADAGSTLIVSGELQNSNVVNVGAGARATAATYQQTGAANTTVDGVLEASMINIQGGSLRGSGQIAGTLQVGPGAIVTPGNSPGHLRVLGSFSMTGGDLLIELAGAQRGIGYDWLDVSGAAHLNGGRVHLVFLGGFTPQAGSSFEFLTAAGGIDGTGFSQFVVDGLASGLQWDVRGGRLDVAAVPEPETWALLIAGLGLVAWKKRRPLG